MTNVLAIDQGTSSTKALVVSDGGEVLGEGNAPVHPLAGAQGAVEQEPEELFQSIVDAGRAANRAPHSKRSWNLEVTPSDENDATAFRLGVRTRF